MDKELEQFKADLLESVRQMKRGKAARTTAVLLTPAADARAKVGVSQSEFAALLGVSVRTLQDWEQGRRVTSEPCDNRWYPAPDHRPADSRRSS